MAQPETFLNIFKNFRAVHVVSLLCGITSTVACSCFSCQIQIYWSARRMEFELDEGHWLFPIFDFTGRSFGIGRWTFLSNGPIKPKLRFSGFERLLLLFCFFLIKLPSLFRHTDDETACEKCDKWLGSPLGSIIFFGPPIYYLPVWEIPFGQHLQNLLYKTFFLPLHWNAFNCTQKKMKTSFAKIGNICLWISLVNIFGNICIFNPFG